MYAHNQRRPFVLAVMLAATFFGYGKTTYATPGESGPVAPLSPYFFVEGGDSGIDRL
ncbi:hypothetical protein MNBD_GAMMA15-1375, partial [hydrothermal vent metagenome]